MIASGSKNELNITGCKLQGAGDQDSYYRCLIFSKHNR
jgi:hypothetical protein